MIRPVDNPDEIKYWLTNAPKSLSLPALVKVSTQRHWIEEDFERAKGEVGLGDYETRGWVGWHRHMLLGMIALWFLVEHQRAFQKKSVRHHR